MARRPRTLSEEDRALWRAFVVAVRPMPGQGLPPAPVVPPPPVLAPAAMAKPPPVPLPHPAHAPPRPRIPAVQVGAPPPGMERGRWRDLHRGRTRPERTLDLHGRRAQDAWHAVRAFLHAAQADGLRCVAVVTGKGPMPEGGVLRRELPHWLNAPELRPLVLGAAYPHAANQGAVHLLLRRRK